MVLIGTAGGEDVEGKIRKKDTPQLAGVGKDCRRIYYFLKPAPGGGFDPKVGQHSADEPSLTNTDFALG